MKNKYRKTLAKYRLMVEGWPDAALDFSDEAAMIMHDWESLGGPLPPDNNGFRIGKEKLDLQITMWRDEIAAGRLFVFELRADQSLALFQNEIESAWRAAFKMNQDVRHSLLT